MKDEIHPDYQNCKVHCGCGNTFLTRSTKAEIHVEICGACHPFYTGKQKFVDTAGRIQRFQEKFKWTGDAAQRKAADKGPKKKVAAPAPSAEQ
ncbi:50S ribosomal protein L31 [bacterium]|nr:50S ribosomal protein L31 [bacterium]